MTDYRIKPKSPGDDWRENTSSRAKGVMQLKDNEIIALFNERDEDAIAEAEKAYGKYCLSVAFGILDSESDAEECVNDTWMRAWNSIPPACPSSLKAYLGTITRNLSIDRLRAGKTVEVSGNIDEAELVPDSRSVEDEAITNEIKTYVNEWLGTLDEKQRNIFVCRYFFCREYYELAERFGMGENRVRSIVSRLRKKLAGYLKERGFRYE